MKVWSIRQVATMAVIAALYTVVTGVFAPIAFREVQVRISEALCVLALFTPAALPGLTLGCFLSNLLWSPFGFLDVALGTLATFLGVWGVYYFREKNRWLALCMPVVTNALLVPVVLLVFVKQAYLLNVLLVGAGEAVACLGLGYPLSKALDKVKDKVFA